MSSLQFRTRPQKPRTRNRRDHSIRVLVAFGLILLCFCLLVARFVWLQVVKHEDFMVQATQNRISLIPTPPTRGEIVDVNGVVLAHNYPAYSLEIIPNEIEMKVEELVEALRPYADISEGDLRRFQRVRAMGHADFVGYFICSHSACGWYSDPCAGDKSQGRRVF